MGRRHKSDRPRCLGPTKREGRAAYCAHATKFTLYVANQNARPFELLFASRRTFLHGTLTGFRAGVASRHRPVRVSTKQVCDLVFQFDFLSGGRQWFVVRAGDIMSVLARDVMVRRVAVWMPSPDPFHPQKIGGVEMQMAVIIFSSLSQN